MKKGPGNQHSIMNKLRRSTLGKKRSPLRKTSRRSPLKTHSRLNPLRISSNGTRPRNYSKRKKASDRYEMIRIINLFKFIDPFFEFYKKENIYAALTGSAAVYLYALKLKEVYERIYGQKDYIDKLIMPPNDIDLLLFFKNDSLPTPYPEDYIHPNSDTKGFLIDYTSFFHNLEKYQDWSVYNIESRNGTTITGDRGNRVDIIRNYRCPSKTPEEYKKGYFNNHTCELNFKGKQYRVLRLEILVKGYEELFVNSKKEGVKMEKIKRLNEIIHYFKYYNEISDAPLDYFYNPDPELEENLDFPENQEPNVHDDEVTKLMGNLPEGYYDGESGDGSGEGFVDSDDE